MTQPTAKDHEQQLIDYLIEAEEAVEYGELWTPKTTHEWWTDSAGVRHCRLVQTYHGGGNRGDDDQAEYVRRLIDMGRARHVDLDPSSDEMKAHLRGVFPENVTHVITPDGTATRIRHYAPPPEGMQS